MRPEITLYGAWYGDGDIYNNRIDSAMGRLSGSTLTIQDVLHDDREALSLMMLASGGASWGMALPFSLPEAVYQDFSLRDWPALLNFAQTFERADLEHLLEVAELFDPGNECRRPGDGCRVTDAESGAFSPLRQTVGSVVPGGKAPGDELVPQLPHADHGRGFVGPRPCPRGSRPSREEGV